jgi:hypothetical protein
MAQRQINTRRNGPTSKKSTCQNVNQPKKSTFKKHRPAHLHHFVFWLTFGKMIFWQADFMEVDHFSLHCQMESNNSGLTIKN